MRGSVCGGRRDTPMQQGCCGVCLGAEVCPPSRFGVGHMCTHGFSFYPRQEERGMVLLRLALPQVKHCRYIRVRAPVLCVCVLV